MTMSTPSVPEPARSGLSAPELQSLIRYLNLGQPLIHYRNPEGTFEIMPLAASAEIVIGRQPGSGITLDWDRSVSRVHAILRPLGLRWTIEDDGLSRNGTFVNGGRVKAARHLENGDAILIGSVLLMFRAPEKILDDSTHVVVAPPAEIALTPAQQTVLTALCRPMDALHPHAEPASNRRIAEELLISVETVKSHMLSLAQLFAVDQFPPSQRRYVMAQNALRWGLVADRGDGDVFEHSPVPAVICDHEATIVAANRAALAVFERAKHEIPGMNLLDLFGEPDRSALRQSVRSLTLGELDVYRATHRLGHAKRPETWIELSIAPHHPIGRHEPLLLAQLHDVTSRYVNELELRYLADHDGLTGLLNRRRFEQELRRVIAETARYGQPGALLLLDVDHFKSINDTLGHLAGDQILVGVAEALRGVLRETDSAVRLGGDEFAVLLPQTDEHQAQTVASRIVLVVRELTQELSHSPITISVSIGIGTVTTQTQHVEEILAAADSAMYRAKRSGGDGAAFASGQETVKIAQVHVRAP
ncbi:MAG: diguanylate cyclase domain-containing protein [Solirubrobacteraceae bacterium]|jgi:diguanylate cyclase (GGDEF)-like protein/PAS domain S-box-containing protein